MFPAVCQSHLSAFVHLGLIECLSEQSSPSQENSDQLAASARLVRILTAVRALIEECPVRVAGLLNMPSISNKSLTRGLLLRWLSVNGSQATPLAASEIQTALPSQGSFLLTTRGLSQFQLSGDDGGFKNSYKARRP